MKHYEKTISDFLLVFSNLLNDIDQLKADDLLYKAYSESNWFTKENIRLAVNQWVDTLKNLENNDRLHSYFVDYSPKPKNVGIVMAGNIPLVGFHDLFSVLLSGHHAQIKLSKSDSALTNYIFQEICKIDTSYQEKIEISERLKNMDAVIATGSDNTQRYFEYYFRNIPSILRGSRNSVAILDGFETKEDMINLGSDIFNYFGLGCRSISKIFLPKGYEIKNFFEPIEHFTEIRNHYKYFNNYEYHLAISLINREDFYSNDYLLLRNSEALASPIGVVHFSYYNNLEDVEKSILENTDKIQCVVSNNKKYLSFGQSQKPNYFDFADGVDTLEFLVNLK